MKTSTCFLIFLLFLAGQTTEAQCNSTDLTAVKLGQVITDTSFCPSSGIITLNNVTGGGGDYIYEIVSGPVIRIVQSQNYFNALPAGDYVVRVNGCNGSRKDTLVKIIAKFSPLASYSIATWKTGGLTCGFSNDGVYKIKNNYYNYGRPPFRYQVSTGTDFTSVPYLPGFDTATLYNLNAATTYNVRITDACNNLLVTAFTTAAVVGTPTLSVPELNFNFGSYYKCSGTRSLYFDIKDSATGGIYNPELSFIQTPYWGSLQNPHIRIQLKNTVTNQVLFDDNRILRKSDWSFAGYGVHYYLDSAYVSQQFDGETGLTYANRVGRMPRNWSPFAAQNQIHTQYFETEFPINTPLTVTMFFPGGAYCGSTVPAYSKSYNITLTGNDNPAPVITAIIPTCVSTTSYLKVEFSGDFIGNIKLIDPSPAYNVVSIYPNPIYGMLTFASANGFYFYNSSFLAGHTYRVIIEDKCGRKDSMDFVYNPGYTPPPPISMQDTVIAEHKCNLSSTDSIYHIALMPAPTSFTVTKISIAGIPDSLVQVGWYEFPNGSSPGFISKPLLPPGTYTYTVYWQKDCSTSSTVKTITINPAVPKPYTAVITPRVTTSTGSCNIDGNTSIDIDVYLKKGDNSFTLNNLRLTAVPNNSVFPLLSRQGLITSLVNSAPKFSMYLSETYPLWRDSSYSASFSNLGLILNPGQEGNYTFAMDVVCNDGTFVTTVYKTITVNNITEYKPGSPSLKKASSLVCDGSTDLKIFMFTEGGRSPYTYEYKLESSNTFLYSGNAGADSTVSIVPAPPAGTIYDLRVTDACGISSSSKVSVGSLTGKFYIYQTPLDCAVNPFDVRVTTSWVTGAYYTWKRNGNIVAQGYNTYFTDINGVSMDSITVDINIYGCYYRAAARTIIFTNPCNILILPVKTLTLNGSRLSPSYARLNWNIQNENIAYFILQKGNDGVSFSDVERVNAFNTNGQHSYSHNDMEASPIVYYRIKAVEKMGSVSYSNVVKVENREQEKKAIAVVPNPAHDVITLFVRGSEKMPFMANIYNDKGQLVKNIYINAFEIINGKKIDISSLANGNYFISLVNSREVMPGSRFIKL